MFDEGRFVYTEVELCGRSDISWLDCLLINTYLVARLCVDEW